MVLCMNFEHHLVFKTGINIKTLEMSKTMCKTKDADKRARKQENPKYECSKCGEKVNKEKYVCKPEKN